VRVHFRVIEGSRQRIQVFEGIVIKRQGAGARETFTVARTRSARRRAHVPLHREDRTKDRGAGDRGCERAKLYYLRGKVGKKARVRELRPALRRVAALAASPSS